MPRPLVCVFVPTLDRRELLLETLRSLAEQTRPVPVMVVDNGSTDGSVKAVRREHPDVRVLELHVNRGFGPALNAAVGAHPAERLILANNDVRYDPRFVEAVLDELGPSTASVAGVLVRHAAPGIIDSAGIVVDSTLLAFDYLHGEAARAAHDASPPLGATGGAALVSLAAFEAVGGFDERILAYLEDVDLALRFRAAGFACRLAPGAHGIHRHSATLGSGSATKNRLMGWSRGYMLRRYGVLRSPRLAARVVATEAIISIGQLAIDGTASGIAGRLSGWRAASGLRTFSLPSDATLDISLGDALRRRATRRLVR